MSHLNWQTRGRHQFQITATINQAVNLYIPGWASDYRIFDFLYNGLPTPNPQDTRILTKQITSESFTDDLYQLLLQNKINNLTIHGFSLGGFLAVAFAKKHPHLVSAINLYGIRAQYPAQEIKQVRALITRNKTAFLKKFYQNGFYATALYKNFEKDLWPDYKNFDLPILLQTLDLLESLAIHAADINSQTQLKIYHGQYDRIAPVSEIQSLTNQNSSALTVVPYGHFG